MTKYIVSIVEYYCASVDYTVEAESIAEAEDIASKLHAQASETPQEEIELIDWEINDTQEV